MIEVITHAEDNFDPDYPIDDERKFQNFPMLFWDELKRLKK